MKFVLAFLSLALPLLGKPNFLFILTDDQSHHTIAALGNSEIKTPHLDKLARSGTAFTNTYNMGAWHGAVCVASRSMLLHGRTLWQAQAIDNPEDGRALIASGETWPQLLKNAGYGTYFAGKWHVPLPPEKIFDQVRHKRPGMPNDFQEGYQRPKADGSDPWDAADPQWEGHWKGGKHWSEVLVDDAEHYFAEIAEREDPFFMYLAFAAPHDPRQAPQEFLDLYPSEKIALPKNFLPTYPYMEAMDLLNQDGRRPLLRDEDLAPLPRTPHAVQVHRREYYAAISHLDAQVGRILAALEKSGKAEDTVIIFTSDHGLACGEHGLLGKQNMYEHSLKAPFLIAGPGIPANERRPQLIHLQDALPTTLQLAGVSLPDFIEFQSLLPYLAEDGAPSGRESFVAAYKNHQRMIRVGEEKLIVYPTSQTVRYFDLARDPHEINDLAHEEAKKERVAELFQRLRMELQNLGDPLDLSGWQP
ncbi:sulfatase-like hydrolase/transferase [Roseibacillus ishigakijimensis]|uniref:Sulfatase-like hydrolase/transferase n=1 Tax=Roseibacillus ishigakijimensis TaxID=454146 RepID=A0A934VLR4_9BACT|nr:sulfatase-like hydrolase/transferase [Roseibacillus ishigakijimensis]MBK1833165.1 sulfatase-like hydrolase/transferase [Roseibacillus ishigakijimensis]